LFPESPVLGVVCWVVAVVLIETDPSVAVDFPSETLNPNVPRLVVEAWAPGNLATERLMNWLVESI